MKRISALLGLALLVGCQSSDSSDCPRKDKSCGKNLTHVESRVIVQNEEPAAQNASPSN